MSFPSATNRKIITLNEISSQRAGFDSSLEKRKERIVINPFSQRNKFSFFNEIESKSHNLNNSKLYQNNNNNWKEINDILKNKSKNIFLEKTEFFKKPKQNTKIDLNNKSIHYKSVKILAKNSKNLSSSLTKPSSILPIQKIIISKVKNLSSNNKIEKSEKEICVNIRLKLNPVNCKKKLNINQGNVYNTNGYFHSFSQTEKNGFKFALKNYDMFSNNFLNMRKTIGVFDAQNIKQLNKGLGYNPNNKSTKNRHQIIDIPDEDENEVIYPKYFLPSPGFGLLVQ